ncbi:Hypothetical protein NTJ_15987 [Nesidiocoris tenuis]|uniref:Uncharacterized protein n=1 Tax=Nesidiocoris tenuis TaxID=355587 RepID=A0ABN7BFL3_9HEMI|nr:Hypothetical protein NTJ_15987 [Nesidiocoris tenuis]
MKIRFLTHQFLYIDSPRAPDAVVSRTKKFTTDSDASKFVFSLLASNQVEKGRIKEEGGETDEENAATKDRQGWNNDWS